MTTIEEETRCLECGEKIDESLDLSAKIRKPCSNCGSTKRAFALCITENVVLHDIVKTKSKLKKNPTLKQ